MGESDDVRQMSYDQVIAEIAKIKNFPALVKKPMSVFESALPMLQQAHPQIRTPRHVLEVLKHQRKRFDQLGRTWVDLETKNSVYTMIMSEHVPDATHEQLASAERTLQDARAGREEHERELQSVVDEILHLAQSGYEDSIKMEDDVGTLYALAKSNRQIEDKMREIEAELQLEESKHTAQVQSIQTGTSARDVETSSIARECELLEAQLAAQMEANERARTRLAASRLERDAAVAEARRIEEASSGVDVQVDELGAWYKEMHDVLAHLVGITAVHVRAANAVEVVFPSYESEREWRMHVLVAAPGVESNNVDRSVEVHVQEFPAPLDDILDDVNTFFADGSAPRALSRRQRRDEALPRVVNEVVRRVRRWEARQAELARIEQARTWRVSAEDAVSGCKVTLTALGGRHEVLTFWLDWDYPKSAGCTELHDVRVRGLSDVAAKQRYRELIVQSEAMTLTEMLELIGGVMQE
ncbi:hypothetical protein M427DRAFT_54503 [Gonapodya prolifera JEL478]|uniref:Uncharacterized protein n=1 Tax=Gonapodya prolifera (strain JEL478) TaxID=1344416 RepID=A0A139ALJ6_GONPJ|nr:hypothetical protein M427DRAFT_54503 [Gonapodya prolifera JEL478]|eukprot:KXS17568.1 hypothetical protein M427DRAFT_54503 [Gonapodya prolifera JEL478]